MKAQIAILGGDGIGPEVVAEGVKVLRAIAARFEHSFECVEAPVGGRAIDEFQNPLPPETLELCKSSHAVLLGAVGGPKWDPPTPIRPEAGLLALRKGLGLFANLRPVAPHPKLRDASPLKAELLRDVDVMVVRELTGGIYFGEKTRTADKATDLCTYSVEEVERVVRVAGKLAQGRRKKLASVDKANVLETSRLWRAVTERVMKAEFPDVQLSNVLVDACAMHLIRRPADFDVIVTENMFGDILTDEASVLAGSIGLLPSASLGQGTLGLYEPIHGSAPDIAGQGLANPLGTISSVAMLLRHSLLLEREARAVEAAVSSVIDAGIFTAELAPKGTRPARTSEVGDAVVERLKNHG
jgi:3-isopropylmalate dehydrogenase